MIRRTATTATLAALFTVTAACGASEDTKATGAKNSGYKPVTFKNCGADVTVDAEPERVVLLDSGGVTQLDAVDALDRVVATAGEYPTEYFGDDVNETLEKIPALTSAQTSTGGVDISVESIIDAEPDLVIGYTTETVTREALAKADIPLYVLPAYCDEQEKPSYQAVLDEVTLFGRLFANEEAAATVNTELRARLDAATQGAPLPAGTTGAALFVAGDASAVYAYTDKQLVDVQLTELGIENVFADLKDFVPEISAESLIEADPEILVLLYTDTSLTPEQITNLVKQLPAAGALTAVKNDTIYPLLLNYSQPSSPLTVTGLEKLRDLVSS
jgi:iron complex transport system substrate-binding protein